MKTIYESNYKGIALFVLFIILLICGVKWYLALILTPIIEFIGVEIIKTVLENEQHGKG